MILILTHWIGTDALKELGVEFDGKRFIYKGNKAVMTDTGLVFLNGNIFPLSFKKQEGTYLFKGDEIAPILFNLGVSVFWDYEDDKLFKGKASIKKFVMGKVDSTYRITIESEYGGEGFEVYMFEDSIVVLGKGLYGKFRKILGDGRFVNFVDVLHTKERTRFVINLGFGAGKADILKNKKGIIITIYPIKIKEKERIPVIVIDPGHGGNDAGAVANGYKEKDINLKVALKVAKILNGYGYKVILTRDDDSYVPLSTRARIANKSNATLFVSIHCNASMGMDAMGFETYFLSESRTSEERAVAILENSAIRYDLGNLKPKDEVGIIVGDLIQTLLLEKSYKLAYHIQNKAVEMNLTKDRGLKQAGFYVLKWVSMPSVLVEIGFITNKEEAKMLTLDEYQMKIAKSIAEGIREFLENEERR